MALEKLNSKEEAQKGLKTPRQHPIEVLKEHFHASEVTSRFAYKQALDGLDRVEKESKGPSEIMNNLMQDIIYTALYTTILEELFNTLRIHKEVAIPLIQKFSESTGERDKLIDKHTQNHMNYLRNNGECEGCASCEGHEDIVPLLNQFKKSNLDYFVKLYLEVQTIYCAFEKLLYEKIPSEIDLVGELSPSLLGEYREYMAGYVDERLKTI